MNHGYYAPPPAPKKGMSTGVIIGIVVGCLFGGCMMLNVVSTVAKTAAKTPEPIAARQNAPATAVAPADTTPPPKVETVGVTAAALWNAYQANEVSADDAYKGKHLAVTGIVASISKDMFDGINVHLASPNQFMPVDAAFKDGQKSAVAKLSKGATVKLTCTGGGLVLGRPQLSDCVVAP